MNLYAKVILLLCGLFATYGAIDYTVQRAVILPSFEALEEDLARTDMERVNRSLDDETSQLLLFCADWGNWLETYRFMAGENPDFIGDNMTRSTLEAARLDAVAYVDADSRFVWRQGFDPRTRDALSYAMLAGDALEAGHPFRAAIAAGAQASGLVVTEHGAVILVAAPVLDGAGNGPHRGAVLLGRVITSEVAGRLAEQAQVQLEVSTLPVQDAGTAPSPATHVTEIVRHPTTNEVTRKLADLHGRPAVLLRIDVPRSVSARGRDAVSFALLSLLGASIIVLLVLLAAMRVVVLGPLSRMTRHAVAIAEGDDLTQRMHFRRSDELGTLAREFDRMVDKLAETRRRLVDQSFEAGAAEVSSGLLHNIGNAMTPLAVSIAGLRQRLREAPAGEIDMVLAELDGGITDEARAADLERLLRLASRELGRVVARAATDAEAVACHVEAIQGILAQQLRASGSGPVIETVQLATLVGHSAELLAPALRQRLVVEVDDSLRDVGALPVPRHVLQQVFQNLMLNAAEAVDDPKRRRGRLRIEGRLVPVADGSSLVLRFTDDGVGIEQEHLERIFEKGFSTKSRRTNSGIGLHWCANAVNAIGGSMRAESPGPGRGATLQVTLPVQRSDAAAVPRAA
jgi:sensor domain CHASE-containing protein